MFKLDTEVIRVPALEELADRIGYLVDHAEAGTLRAIRDHDTASDIMEKHLSDHEDVKLIAQLTSHFDFHCVTL